MVGDKQKAKKQCSRNRGYLSLDQGEPIEYKQNLAELGSEPEVQLFILYFI